MSVKNRDLLLVFLVVAFSLIGVLLGEYVLASIEEKKAQPPVINKIIYELETVHHDKEVNYMYGEATAYTPLAGGINCDSDPSVTSQMKPAKNGVIAVNPNVIPYGSEVMIISGKTVIRGQAWDTGGHMMKNPKQVDILMEDINDALEWGRREVHILWW